MSLLFNITTCMSLFVCDNTELYLSPRRTTPGTPHAPSSAAHGLVGVANGTRFDWRDKKIIGPIRNQYEVSVFPIPCSEVLSISMSSSFFFFHFFFLICSRGSSVAVAGKLNKIGMNHNLTVSGGNMFYSNKNDGEFSVPFTPI